MMQDSLQIKITLSYEETRSLKNLSETTCGGIQCEHCPFMLDGTGGRCLRTLAKEVKEKLNIDTRTSRAYSLHNLNN